MDIVVMVTTSLVITTALIVVYRIIRYRQATSRLQMLYEYKIRALGQVDGLAPESDQVLLDSLGKMLDTLTTITRR